MFLQHHDKATTTRTTTRTRQVLITNEQQKILPSPTKTVGKPELGSKAMTGKNTSTQSNSRRRWVWPRHHKKDNGLQPQQQQEESEQNDQTESTDEQEENEIQEAPSAERKAPQQRRRSTLTRRVSTIKQRKREEAQKKRERQHQFSSAGGVFLLLNHQYQHQHQHQHQHKNNDNNNHHRDAEDSFKSTSSGSKKGNRYTRIFTFMNVATHINALRWQSSGEPSHHDGLPLLVQTEAIERRLNPRNVPNLTDKEMIRRIKRKTKTLPKHFGYTANNHVMVNNERTKRRIAPLSRSKILDELATKQAQQMADNHGLFHSHPSDLRDELLPVHKNDNGGRSSEAETLDTSRSSSLTTYNNTEQQQQQQPPQQHDISQRDIRIGENVACGASVAAIHNSMMSKQITITGRADTNNILDRRFVYMGTGTSKASDGTLYLCQLFRGP